MVKNVRDRLNIQFCTDEKQFVKHTSSQINIMEEDCLILLKTHKKTVELNKPICIGPIPTDLCKKKSLFLNVHTISI